MKIKYITEGYFKNKADMQVQRAKERELTNREKVANTYSSALVGKVQNIIQQIVYDKRVNPVVASLFYVNGDYDADGKTTYERRDITCRIDYEGEISTIHVNFTLGRVMSTKRNAQPCSEVFMYGEHDYPQILNRLDKNNINANFSKTIKKEITQAIKICESSQRPWYEFILNSNIVIDDINMYTNATDIQEFVIKFGYYSFKYNYYAETKEQFEEKVLSVYKNLAERLTSIINFGVPVKFIIPVRSVLLGNTDEDKLNNDFAISADYVSFTDIFGRYKNLGEIEDVVGLSDKKDNNLARLILYTAVSNRDFSISKYLETSVGEESPLKQINELVRECDHVWITYLQQFICECIDGKFTLVQKGKLLVGSIAFVIGQNMPSSPIRIVMSSLSYRRFTEKNPNDYSISLQAEIRYPDVKVSNTTFKKSTEVHKAMLAIRIFIEKLLRNKLK